MRYVEGIQLDDDNREFEYALDLVENTCQSVYLTGKAGTGKSTFLKYLTSITEKNYVVLTPTGVAALNVKGQTIHSFFAIPLSIFIPDDHRLRFTVPKGEEDATTIASTFKYCENKIQIIKELDLLIIDEISMVRCDLIEVIDKILQYYRKNRKPFGGVQLLLVGDIFQLAPIAKDNEYNILSYFYDSLFFFKAKALQSFDLKYLELKKIYRQKDDKFIEILNEVRSGNVSTETLSVLNSKVIPHFIPPQDRFYITISTHNKNVEVINLKKLAELPGKPHIFEATIVNDFPADKPPADIHLIIKQGAQVMFLKNDKNYPPTYYNGKMGIIKKIHDGFIEILCDDGIEVALSQADWENIEYSWDRKKNKIIGDIKGRFFQYPIKLAWGITVHKSQGLTFENVIADLGSSFAAGQVYVALSRCKTLEGLVLKSHIPRTAIITDPHAVQFSKNEINLDKK